MRKTAPLILSIVLFTTTLFGDQTMSSTQTNHISFSFAEHQIIVELTENSATESLIAMLPLELSFEDYASTEKISYLPSSLDTSNVPAGYAPAAGDLTLYAPWGNLAFFYKPFSYASGLVPLGKITEGRQFLSEMDKAATVRIELLD